jgi:hypothetical protein
VRRAFPRLVPAALLVLAAATPFAAQAQTPGKPPAKARTLVCPDMRVTVRSVTPADASLACDGARDAIAFLASQGFGTDVPVLIDIAPAMPAAAARTAVGCYLESERRVVVLPFAAFRRNRTWMGVPSDARAYRSVVTHEVAHAIAACNYKGTAVPITGKEYIAYVTMLATMETDRRDRVLAAFPDPAFEGDWQMNTMVYLFDPQRFGVRAYRHYMQPGHGREFLQAILQGTAMQGADD